jgi:hypothetical protein
MSWHHQIRPQVYDYLKTHTEAEVPAEVMGLFRELHADNRMRQMRLLAEWLRLLGIFHESGIEAVPYKGVALGMAYYGNFGDREGRDIDLMVHWDDLERIKALMLAEGYVQEGVQGQLSAAYIRRHLCELNYDFMVDGHRLYHVEFHWRPVGAPHGYDLSLGELSGRLVDREVQGRVVRSFDATAHLVLTSMHHGGKEMWQRWKYVNDVALILKSGEAIDWEWYWAVAGRFSAERAFGVGLLLAEKWLGAPLPEAARAGLGDLERRRIFRWVEAGLTRSDLPRSLRGGYIRKWRYQIGIRTSYRRGAAIGWYIVRKVLLPRLVPGSVRRMLIKARYGGVTERLKD